MRSACVFIELLLIWDFKPICGDISRESSHNQLTDVEYFKEMYLEVIVCVILTFVVEQ